jgi:GDP-L-fucose synthase
MKLLITGSAGLIGSAIKKENIENAFFADRKHADLTSFSDVMELFEKVQPTHVIHCAALVGGIGGNLMKSGDYFRNNILINTNVLEAARITEVENLVTFMSTCVFPDEANYPLTSDQLHLGPPHPSNFSYAYAKRMLEVQSRAYRNQWGVNFNILVPPNVYGPHDNWSLTEGHVVPALIHKFHKAKLKNEKVEIWGSGKPLREFVYASDIAKLSLWAVFNLDQEEPLMLTSGIETSIAQLVDNIAAEIGFNGEIFFNTSKPDGQMRKPSSAIALEKLNPNFKFTELTTGLKETISWFEKEFPNVRV